MQEIIAFILVGLAIGISLFRIIHSLINAKKGKSVCSCCSHKQSCVVEHHHEIEKQ